MQLFAEDEPGIWSRRVVAQSEIMHYNHSSIVDPEHAIVYEDGQVASSYHNQADVLATVYHCWTATTHRIRSIDAHNRTLTLLQAPHVDIPRCEHASGKRFYLQNARELLTKPGQFYYDRSASELLYLPLPTESSVSNFTAFAPSAITLLNISGQDNKQRLVKDISVQHLSFVHAAADMSGFFEGDCDGQAASNLKTSAVRVANATAVSFDMVGVRHTGGFGVWIHSSCDNVSFTRGLVSDVGAGALQIGAHEAVNRPVGVTVTDNHFSDGGHVYIMGPGVLMSACAGCTIAHNEIHHFSYTGNIHPRVAPLP
jgi:hypothetical protein